MDKRFRLTIRDEDGGERLTPALVERLMVELERETDAVVLTLESEGPSFCEGMDLTRLATRHGDAAEAVGRFAALLRAIAAAPQPVIALVDGPAIGGGVGLAAASDLVIATSRATFGLPETLFGVVPAIILPVLARRVGLARARWLAMGAATLSAAEAQRIGLVDELTGDLEAALAPITRRFERLDREAVAAVKSLASMLSSQSAAHYDSQSVQRFLHHLKRPAATDRIDRFLAGETPWPEIGET